MQLETAGILSGWALQAYLVVGHCRDTLRLGSVRILCGWALQGYLVVGHCRHTLRVGASVKHCRDTHCLGTAGMLLVGLCRDIWWLGTAGILCSSVGHCTAGILGGWSLKTASSRVI